MSTPWIGIAHRKDSSTIQHFHEGFARLNLSSTSSPLFTALVGKKIKTEILRDLLNHSDDKALDSVHGQILLWRDPATSRSAMPRVYIDYEAQVYHGPAQWSMAQGVGPETLHVVDWLAAVPLGRSKITNLLCNRVLSPMCDVVCYFASDLGGIKGVAQLLAEQAKELPACDMPSTSLPRILVIVETVQKHYDHRAAKDGLLKATSRILGKPSDGEMPVEILASLDEHFAEIRMMAIQKASHTSERARLVRRRLTAMRRSSIARKTSDRMLFRRDHASSFVSQLLEHFCSPSVRPFSLVTAARTEELSSEVISYHMKEVVELLPCQGWLEKFWMPLLGSCIMLFTYPPGAHVFHIATVYKHTFESAIEQSVRTLVSQFAIHDNLLSILGRILSERFADVIHRDRAQTTDLHLGQLTKLRSYLKQFRSHRTCLCCLFRAPEKVLMCGHALCDICIRTFGEPSEQYRHSFVVRCCPLCGELHSERHLPLLPPTAGVRVLSIDGGGVRGIIPLAFLQHLESCLLPMLRIPLREHFDFVGGTSAGGLIAMGMFLMRWSVDECLHAFESLARKTFRPRKRRAFWLGRARQLALSYVRDCQYSSLAIEEAFQPAFNIDLKMFNPLCDDTRIFVTSTTAGDNIPCLFTNYNGGPRAPEAGYSLIRAAKPEDDISISDAASCTSAAPWFFKPKSLPKLGSFQDGGLTHNNPLDVALWEMEFLWPTKSTPDFALSLGTGISGSMMKTFNTRSKTESDVSSSTWPSFSKFLKDRSAFRTFQSFMRSVDGEMRWKQIHNSLPTSTRRRFHRLNLPIKGPDPVLDDLAAMEGLKTNAIDSLRQGKKVQEVLDSILAAIFYFEFDNVPIWNDHHYECIGHVLCRLQLSKDGQTTLRERLLKSASYFLVLGHPVRCVEDGPMNNLLFSRKISFTLPSLSDNVWITLRGLTSQSCTISGLPKSAQELINLQGLEMPFGRADHMQRSQKPLRNPRKRKFSEL